MAKIQILELSPAETPMEDLSYDITGNITGGGVIGDLIRGTFDLINRVLDICEATGSENPLQCTIAFFNDLDAAL